ncbi:MAG TPA: pseudouridine-5'-phosphate glycosidase [Kiritimatiellia bacterium]|nr:pseudouridine-5'-phosphate glycosidase [Kiritimatiellia bacterium]
MKVHPIIRAALEEGRAVVALESTLISHGLPYPVNLDTARRLEGILNDRGVAAATCGIWEGVPTVGLNMEQLEGLAKAGKVRKCSRRDLPVVCAREEAGATTVATTMWMAHRAGIRVFSTGGIGGVHRGEPFDVSADVEELGRTPITVVCAGAKAILDLPATREMLETKGVTVVGYQTDEFPAFYSRASGLPVDVRCDSPEEVAAIVRARDELGLTAAVLVTVPVPAEHELPREVAEEAIEQALKDADNDGIRGREVTPFLLARMSQLTGDRSREANLALLERNAQVAAEIAKKV